MKTITDAEFYKLSTKARQSFTGIVKYNSGTLYIKSGICHRIDGPSYESTDGYKEWCVEGKFHNLNGPARLWPNGKERYYINNEEYSKKEWKKHPQVILHKIQNSKEFKDFLRYKNL